MPELYQYNTLPSNNFIRLLELHSGPAGENIKCTLHQVELDKASNYEAISYAWGDPTDQSSILCDNKIIIVTRNLNDALLRLKLNDRSRFLWADAICINQSDDIEKGSQVQQMARIYGNATTVCVWLGYATAQMQPAFELIDDIVSQGRLINSYRTELLDPASDLLPALDLFFSAAWFTRLWVVQEVYGHACVVFYDRHEIPWNGILLVANLLVEVSATERLTGLHTMNFYAPSHIEGAGQDPRALLETFRNFKCSDPRDKVYALLAFPFFSGLRPPIQPDYSKSVVTVFTETSIRVFICCQDLSLLSSIDHEHEIDEKWPSWVPRWDRSRTIQILHMYASGRAQSSLPRIEYESESLTSEGVCISTVSWCGMVVEGGLENPAYYESEFDTLRLPFGEWLSKYLSETTQSIDEILDSLAMTLTVGLDNESKCPPRDFSQFRADFVAYLVEILPSLDLLIPTQRLSQVLRERGLAGDPKRFYTAAIRGCGNKRLFSTQNGEFGVCPRAAQPGDIVVLLYGSNAPCLLRPKGSCYQYVGECYLHHQMHGEAIAMAAKGLLDIKKFELR